MQPILENFSTQIETERLLLRCPQPGDGAAFQAAVNASTERLGQWFSWAHGLTMTLEQAEINARHFHLQFLKRVDLMFYMFLRDMETMIGVIVLDDIDWDVSKFEIGFWLRTGFEGAGYATEGVTAVTQFAFSTLGARRIWAECDTRNNKSIAVIQRCGFVHEVTLKGNSLPPRRSGSRCHLSGEPLDLMIWTLNSI